MSIIERAIDVVAPHTCIRCESEGSLLCAQCWPMLGELLPARCFKCQKLTAGFRVCKSCRSSSRLRSVTTRSAYAAVARELIQKLKFGRARAASRVIAEAIYEALPPLSHNIVIVPVPTASSRRRVRGYDQAVLIAKHLSKLTARPTKKVLVRVGQTRQVGARRIDRLTQLGGAFRVARPSLVSGASILLVDDVLTTGATLETAASVLRATGAKHVDAAVFAQA